MQIMEGAETFLLEGNNGKAVLLLHGYTGTTRLSPKRRHRNHAEKMDYCKV